jgi:hypothetical protein
MNRLVPKIPNINIKYFYYYWKNHSDSLKELYRGSANKSLDKIAFGKYEFPLPSILVQNEIVSKLEDNLAEKKRLEQMVAKADQRAKYILDGYLYSQLKVDPEVAVEPMILVNEIVDISRDLPKPKRRVLKSKKTSPGV